jgi:enterochelin esterase-like enzyme
MRINEGDIVAKINGKILDGVYLGKNYEPHSEIGYKIYVPKAYNGNPAGLIFMFDSLFESVYTAMDELITEKAMPVCIGIGVGSGVLRATIEGGGDRDMRAEEYDQAGSNFPNFIIEELIPHFCEKFKLVLSDNPDMHMVLGGSSGGFAAWNAAWYRNDYFRRVSMISPSFHAFRGGEELLVTTRKSEPKPIKAYTSVAANEPDMYSGNSYHIGSSAGNTLQYAGYDHYFDYFQSGKHCEGLRDAEVQKRALRWIWQDWDTKPVAPLFYSERILRYVDADKPWQECSEPMPSKTRAKTAHGIYTAENGKVNLTAADGSVRVVADGFGDISSIAVSSDKWRLYIADRTRRYVFAMSIYSGGLLKNNYILAHLHLAEDCRKFGADDICVDRSDSVYAATELGVQTITSFGITDCIFSLPGNAAVEEVAFGGINNDVLYAKCGKRIFKRQWKTRGLREDDARILPSSIGYF